MLFLGKHSIADDRDLGGLPQGIHYLSIAAAVGLALCGEIDAGGAVAGCISVGLDHCVRSKI